MTPELWQRVKERFGQAAELPASDWSRFLDAEEPDETVRATTLDLLLHQNDDFDLPDLTSLPPASPDQKIGKYVVVGHVATGGMAWIYEARDPDLGRSVALKILPPIHAMDPESIARFRREARAIARLDHPNIATLYEADVVDDRYFLALEFLGGGDLQDEITALRKAATPREGGPPTSRGGMGVVEALERILPLARALDCAHRNGVIHRDVSPRNSMFTKDGDIKLVDFGLALDESGEPITRVGSFAGTIPYASPEQLDEKITKVDHRTDIYSLGAVLYELLTLRRPIEGSSFEEIAKRSQDEPPRIRSLRPNVPRDLETIVHRALERKPEDRFRTAAEFADELERFLRHEPIFSSPPSPLRRCARWTRRHARVIATVALVLLLVVAALWIDRDASRKEANLARYEELARLGETGRPLARLAHSRRQEFASLLRSLVEDKHGLAPVEALRVTEWEAGWNDYGDELVAATERALLDLSRVNGNFLEFVVTRARAQDLLREVTTFFPERVLDPRWMEPTFLQPRVRVSAIDENGVRVPAQAWYQPIDLATTQPQPAVPLGPLPSETPLTFGYFRFTVAFEDGSLREFDRLVLDSNQTLEIVARHEPLAVEDRDDMVRFGRTENYVVPEHPTSNCHLIGRAVTLEPYAIDVTEVSNGDYQEYLDAHPEAPEPKYWSSIDSRPANWSELPVVGLSWPEMQGYAEWRGKRLPTLAEWNRAARGLNGRRHPWEGEGWSGIANMDAAFLPATTLEECAADYLRNAQPVRSAEAARTPEGIHHMLGNVEEFTGSIMVLRDTEQPLFHARIFAGQSWRDSLDSMDLNFQGYTRTDRRSAMHVLGFRCARSLQPPP